MLHELVLKRLPPPLDGECIEVNPVSGFDQVDQLLQKLLRRCPAERLPAAAALLEPFLCQSSRGGLQGGAQARLAVLRQEMRQLHGTNGWNTQTRWHRITVERIEKGGIPSRDAGRWYVSVRSVLDAFNRLSPRNLKRRLNVEFARQQGQVGMDYGGLTSNMYREFWGIIDHLLCRTYDY